MSRFTPTAHQVAAFVHAHPLALVISNTGSGAHTTPLPLLATTGPDGAVTEFFGHFGLANPQVAALQADPRALILFQGPHAYIPPAAVPQDGWAPTWNYALTQFETSVRFVPDETERNIDEMVHHMEGDGWSAARLGDRYQSMLTRIIAFRATVVAASAKFKLGQDETRRNFDAITEWLGDVPLAGLMRDARDDG